MLYSDAGGHMAGGCMIVNKQVWEDSVFQVSLSEEEVSRSSTYRELRGIEEGIKALGGWIKGKGIRWHCDNWSACKIVEYGSMKPDCHTVAKRINDLIRVLDVNFEIVWLSRSPRKSGSPIEFRRTSILGTTGSVRWTSRALSASSGSSARTTSRPSTPTG